MYRYCYLYRSASFDCSLVSSVSCAACQSKLRAVASAQRLTRAAPVRGNAESQALLAGKAAVFCGKALNQNSRNLLARTCLLRAGT